MILFTPFEENILDWVLLLTALFCSNYQVIYYHIWTSLVSLTVICCGFDSMNLKHTGCKIQYINKIIVKLL